MLTLPNDSVIATPPRDIVALRRELALAERFLRERAEPEAVSLARAERVAWQQARADCLQLERIRRQARARLKMILISGIERFPGERSLAEAALREIEKWELDDSAAYTILSFARLRDRMRYLREGTEREAAVLDALKRGGVYTERGYWQEILR